MRNSTLSLRGLVLKAAAIGALSIAAIGLVTTSASAGTSNRTNGCYGQWWSTAFAGYCDPVTVSGQFQLVGICDFQADYYGTWRWMSAGSYVSPFDNGQCTFSVSRSYVLYSNG